MTEQLLFRQRFEFEDLPSNWEIASIALDWHGEPLLLARELASGHRPRLHEARDGSRPEPQRVRTKAYHIVYDFPRGRSVRLKGAAGRHFGVQRFGDGWLTNSTEWAGAGSPWSNGSNLTNLFDAGGRLVRQFESGNCRNDVQTTEDGQIWISYGDESDESRLRCFDADGAAMFDYQDAAVQADFPLIEDCYALNVADNQAVWVSYLSGDDDSTPLVLLRDFELADIWPEFSCIGHGGLAIRGSDAVYECCGYPSVLMRRELSSGSSVIALEPVDERGQAITLSRESHAIARGPRLLLDTEDALYEMV